MDGWFTDTSIDPDAVWTDLRFGSPAYFAALEADRDLDLGAMFAIDRAVRFEHLGRHFRVTPDDIEGAPKESEVIPAALTSAHNAGLQVSWLGEQVVEPEPEPTTETPGVDESPTGGALLGCAGSGGTNALPSYVLLALLGLVVSLRRRRALRDVQL